MSMFYQIWEVFSHYIFKYFFRHHPPLLLGLWWHECWVNVINLQNSEALFIFPKIFFLCSDWKFSIDMSSCPLILFLLSLFFGSHSMIFFVWSLSFSILIFPFNFFTETLYFSLCFKSVRNCLLKHLYTSCFKVFVR